MVRKWRHHQLWELGASRETHLTGAREEVPVVSSLQVSTSSDQCRGKKLRASGEYRK